MSQELPNLKAVPLNHIDVSDRLRDVNADEVKKLQISIADQGLQNPIVIRPAHAIDRTDKTRWAHGDWDGYVLVSGGHRYHAAQALGWAEIPAIIVEPETPLKARLLEIDENLYRHELNALDRAVFLAERKAIYEELHPETKHGAQGGVGSKKNENDTVSFSKDTAEKVGLSKRTIERATSIYDGLSPTSLERIKGTWLASKQGELLHLSTMNEETQAQYLDLMLRDDDPIQGVAKCKAHLAGTPTHSLTTEERTLEKLKRLWAQADPATRATFRAHIGDADV